MASTYKILHHYDQMITESLKWINIPKESYLSTASKTWKDSTWFDFKIALAAQGLGLYLYHCINQMEYFLSLPQHFAAWIVNQSRLNKVRIERIHSMIHTILRETSRIGIKVMPLKGSLLTTHHYPQPEIRPMADGTVNTRIIRFLWKFTQK